MGAWWIFHWVATKILIRSEAFGAGNEPLPVRARTVGAWWIFHQAATRILILSEAFGAGNEPLPVRARTVGARWIFHRAATIRYDVFFRYPTGLPPMTASK